MQAAEVIGTEVPLPRCRPLPNCPRRHCIAVWHLLQAAEFYETRLFPERAYTFKHALTQQAAYQSLLTSTWQRYHAQLAQALKARPETAETQPDCWHITTRGEASRHQPWSIGSGPAGGAMRGPPMWKR